MALLKRRELVIVVGPAGAGKTTYARAHYPQHAHLSHERLIRAMTPDGALHYYSTLRAVAHRLRRHAVTELLARGYAVTLADTVATRRERAVWISLAQAHGASVHVVRLLTPREECVRRAQADASRPRSSRHLWPDLIARWYRVYEPVDAEGEGLANYAEVECP